MGKAFQVQANSIILFKFFPDFFNIVTMQETMFNSFIPIAKVTIIAGRYGSYLKLIACRETIMCRLP